RVHGLRWRITLGTNVPTSQSASQKEHDMRLATWSLTWTTFLAVCLAAAPAQEKQIREDKTGGPRVIPVWPKDAPGSEKWTQEEVEFRSALFGKIVRNVVQPTLTAFLPERSKANGAAVIVCPGGGFRFLAKDEGIEEAKRLRARGVAVFILKHRLMDTGAT